MRDCAFCRKALTLWTEWKGTDGQFYCSEFCADSEETSNVLVPPKPREVGSLAGAQR
jgi:hypothetical protein